MFVMDKEDREVFQQVMTILAENTVEAFNDSEEIKDFSQSPEDL